MGARHAVGQRWLVTLVAVVVVATACGGSNAPASGAPGTAPASTNAAPSGATVEGVELIDFAATADPAEIARRELDLVREIRADAGMAALLGENGPTIFAALDATEATFAQGILRDAATAVETGAFPAGAAADPLDGRLASLDGSAVPQRLSPGAIDVSVFAETGFSASALMSLFTGLVERADGSSEGTVSRSEPHRQEGGGLRQEMDLTTTMSMRTGGGRVNADLTLTATDRIFTVPDGSFVALYTSTSTGHFDVAACPNDAGIAEGTYTFETKHELNDVSATSASRSGGGRSVNAPFRLVDGPDAKLKQIEATLDLRADARNPGGSDGSGAFDWAASQVLQVVMPAGGGVTTGSGEAAAVTGTGGERAGGAMFLSSSMAQLFMGQVGKEAQTFWRSGKCFEVTTNEESRKVERGEQVDVEVSAVTPKFGGSEVKQPIGLVFSGKERIEPDNGSFDIPARVTFTAGQEPRDKGILTFEQISVRGIARKALEFEVQPEDLNITIDGRLSEPGAHLTLSTGEWKLEKTDRGFEQTVTADITGTVDVLGCSHNVTDELTLKVLADVDEADRDLVRLFVFDAAPDMGKEEEITCQGVTTRALIPSSTFTLPFLGIAGYVEVRVGETTTFRESGVQATVTLRREETAQ